MCFTIRPRSKTKVFSPASQSSLAAHPPLIPEYSDRATKKQLDPNNLQKQGFTQYQKDKTTGKYYKSAGNDPRAPEQIDPKRL